MTPAFVLWSDFFMVGGYALYVWLAVAMSVISLVVLVLYSALQHRAILRGTTQQWAREVRTRAAQV